MPTKSKRPAKPRKPNLLRWETENEEEGAVSFTAEDKKGGAMLSIWITPKGQNKCLIETTVWYDDPTNRRDDRLGDDPVFQEDTLVGETLVSVLADIENVKTALLLKTALKIESTLRYFRDLHNINSILPTNHD